MFTQSLLHLQPKALQFEIVQGIALHCLAERKIIITAITIIIIARSSAGRVRLDCWVVDVHANYKVNIGTFKEMMTKMGVEYGWS